MNREEYESYENRYNLKEEHKKLLEILDAFDIHCREKQVKYSLADGTLLGMVRYSNFIPWDDDADVMVTREEYKKLIETLDENNEIVVFKVCFLDRVSTRRLLKQGYYIDLFVNDVMPENKLLFKMKIIGTGILRTYFYGNTVENVWHKKDSGIKNALRGVFTNVTGRIICAIYKDGDVFVANDKLANINNASKSHYYTRFTSRMFETRRRIHKDAYDAGYQEVEFAGIKLMALKRPDIFLSDMYGDYNTMPPEEKRCPSHPVNMLDSIKKCFKYYN